MSQTKQSLTSLRKSFYNKKPVFKAYWLYKKPQRSELLITLKNRIDYIFATGLIKEAQELRDKLQASHWALEVMGFKEALMYVDKLLDLATAKERAFIRHRQYAKRQYTWFNAEKFYRLVY
jgi:tRNA dimethylallyltransferase